MGKKINTMGKKINTMGNEETNNETKTSQAGTIRESISKKIKESNPTVVEGVIDSLVKDELEKRKEMVKKGVEKYEELEKAFNKMKPDHIMYNLDGTEQSSSWSKDGLEKYNKAKKELEALNTAIENAITQTNYEPLSKVINK
jgi:hypothetical protein